MKDVQCYELFGGIALKNHTFSLGILADFRRQARSGNEGSVLMEVSWSRRS